jgi:hypothetical protein
MRPLQKTGKAAGLRALPQVESFVARPVQFLQRWQDVSLGEA